VPPEIGNLTKLRRLDLYGNKLSSLPSDITHLKDNLSTLYVNHNALDISDPEIIQFLDAKQSNWRQTQTVAPTQLTVTTLSNNSITLTWSAIAYQSDKGGYEMFYSPGSNDAYTIYNTTLDKSIEQMTISGLISNTTYFFKARSVTYPHTSGSWYNKNPNTVYSNFTPDISAQTLDLIAVAKQSLSGVINYSNLSIDITGNGADFYQYKLNQNAWSEDFSINTPLIINSLEDGPYMLLIKGKNNAGELQDPPTVYTWRVDTQANPPKLNLPSQWDTGKFNNDQITHATQLTLTGTCENGSTIEFFDALQSITPQDITIEQHTFTASFTLTKGTHSITAIQTDLAGNQSQPSTPLHIQIDTQVDQFSMDTMINNTTCLWALDPQTITLTGTREPQSTISVDKRFTGHVTMFYPNDHSWKAQLINMPTGTTTLLIHATDLAGNTADIEKIIHLPVPETAIITTPTHQLLADHTQTLSMTFSFFTKDQTPICVDPTVRIETTLGEIINPSLSNNQLLCLLKADRNKGTAIISAHFNTKPLGSKTIDMIPGPFATIKFNTTPTMIETGMATDFITLQLMDAYDHPVFVTNSLNLKVDSTAKTNGYFSIQKGDFWDWDPAQVVFVVKPETNTFQFMFKSSVPGTFYIKASADQYAITQTLPINVIDSPLALLPDVPSGYTNVTNFRVTVKGGITAYQYQFNSENWHPETSINTPILLSNVSDGMHTLKVIGKNELGSWQNKSMPTIAQWIVDTDIHPPTQLLLPSDYDTGRLTNDHLTRLTTLEIKGVCESNASIQLFANEKPLSCEKMEVTHQAFAARVVLSQGVHRISAIQTDAATNISEQSEPLVITIDHTPPDIMILSENEATSLTKYSKTNTWQWQATENHCIFRFDINQNTSWIATGAFTSETAASKGDITGQWYLHVQAQDLAGNISDVLSVPIAIEDHFVNPPELSLPTQWDSGRRSTDHITHFNQLTIKGSCENGATIQFWDDDKPITYDTISFDTQTFSARFVFTEGNHHITAIQTDQAGNVSQASEPLCITIDTHLENFTLNDRMDDTRCLWAFEPEMVTFSGNREPGSIIGATVNNTPLPISYPDHVTWMSESTQMATGFYTLVVQATDTAGNQSVIKKPIARLIPEKAMIETPDCHLIADGQSQLGMNITFYAANEQQLCVHEDVNIETSMGQILLDSLSIANKQLSGILQADDQTGIARVSVLYNAQALGHIDIDMVAGPPDQLVFQCAKSMQEVNLGGELITLQLVDKQGHPALLSKNVSIKLDSTAKTSGEFYIQKGDFWDWQPTPLMYVFKPGVNTFRFMFRSSITGDITIQAIDPDTQHTSQFALQVIPSPMASIMNAPSGLSNLTDYQLTVKGEFITHYQYQLDNQEWQKRLSIDTPIILSHLADGDHTLNVVGKNSLESWQNKSMATIVQWTIDTHILPPTHLKLHTDYDSGLFNTDLITNQSYIQIEGQCEANASIQLYCNTQRINNATIAVAQDTFTAFMVLSDSVNQITATQIDRAGNVSQASDPLVIMFDQTPPQVKMVSENDISQATQSKTWQWTANEANCTFRHEINQYENWTVTGNFTGITSASISHVNGVWYCHIQARDVAGNISEKVTIPVFLDNTPPMVTGLSDTSIEISDCKQWYWNASETSCTFRYVIDQNEQWDGVGDFSYMTQVEKCHTFGKWYLHVQAKDAAGNYSLVKTVFAEFKKPSVYFTNTSSSGKESQTSIQIDLSLSHCVDQDVVVEYQSVKDSYNVNYADEGFDYVLPNTYSARINAGEQQGFIPLTIIDDHQTELNETIRLQLMSSNVMIGKVQKYQYIINNDDYPGLLIDVSNPLILTEGSQPKTLSVTLTSSPQYSVNIDIHYDTQSIQITPEKLLYHSEQWDTPQLIMIKTKDDTVYKGNQDIEIVFQAKNSNMDDYYKTISQNIWIHLQDDENPPTPPELSCPQSPSNNAFPEFTWNSGGGSNRFLYQLDNNAWFETTLNSYKSSALSEGPHIFSIKEYNAFTSSWSNYATCPIVIDTGKPCSDAQSTLTIDAESMMIDITYTYADRYNGEICGDPLNHGSGVKQVELWVAKPGDKAYALVQTDQGDLIDGYFQYTPTQEGRYRFMTRAKDASNNDEMDKLPDPSQTYDCETVFAENFSGYAILAVGAVDDEEGLESHTLSADNIYRHLINRHFGIMHDMSDPLDHIKYLNKRQHTGVDQMEANQSYETILEQTIKEWALTKMTLLPGPLYIILIDHGAPDHFYLGDQSETVTASELNQWITQLETDLQKKVLSVPEIVIIMDTCYSGSFINDLSKPGRIIITSTSDKEVSFRGPKKPSDAFVRDGAYFANNLFFELSKGNRLSESFKRATYLTEMLTSSNHQHPMFPFYDTALQHPLLDDNGDALGHNVLDIYGDGINADLMYLGYSAPSAHPVEIVQVQILPFSTLENHENTFTFKVTVQNQDWVEKLCVEIKSPDTNIPSFTDEYRQKILNLHQVCLTYQANENIYVGSFDQCKDPGQYALYFYVEDQEQVITYFNEISVYKKALNNTPPVDFELIRPITESESQQVIFEWENTRDHHRVTYSLFLSKTNTFEPDVTFIKHNINESQFMMELPKDWDKCDIYWRVRAIDIYGAYTDSNMGQFKTDYVNSPGSSIMIVQVYDTITKLPVSGARVLFVSDTNTVDLTMLQSGRYIDRLKEIGEYNVTIQAEGYETKRDVIHISDYINLPLSFALTYIVQTGDLNRDNQVDIGDAIICLQGLSKIHSDNFYYDKKALIDNNLGLRDAIYILRSMGE
jgi:hypothetical protein